MFIRYPASLNLVLSCGQGKLKVEHKNIAIFQLIKGHNSELCSQIQWSLYFGYVIISQEKGQTDLQTTTQKTKY